MDFDPDRAPTAPRDAATVILLRARKQDGTAEVFLLKRHRGASFMARAYVFPGGGREGQEDLRVTAARELFEEAGVLLARGAKPERLPALRARAAQGEAFDAVLAGEGLALDLDRLVPFAHWITPSAEKKRFSARFFIAELPAGQTPSFDAKETTEELWATPDDALARDDLGLPPPQLRTLLELAPYARRGTPAVLDFARTRGPHIRPIVPRIALIESAPSGFALLAPWDPDYVTLGKGEGDPFPEDHPLAGGPSRFVLDGAVWRQELARP